MFPPSCTPIQRDAPANRANQHFFVAALWTSGDLRDERWKSGSIIAFGVTRDKAIERMTSQGRDRAGFGLQRLPSPAWRARLSDRRPNIGRLS
jgi:hypothetical protein